MARRPSLNIQTLLFDRERFNESQAKRWAREHGFRYGAVDTTDDYHRLRQLDPGDLQAGSFRTFDLTPGVRAVGGRFDNPGHGQGDDDEMRDVHVRMHPLTDDYVIVGWCDGQLYEYVGPEDEIQTGWEHWQAPHPDAVDQVLRWDREAEDD